MQPQYPGQGPGPQWGYPPPSSPYPPPPPPKKQPGVLAAIGAIAVMCVVCMVIGRFSPPPPAPAPSPAPGATPAPTIPMAPAAPTPTPANPTPAPPAPSAPPAAQPVAPEVPAAPPAPADTRQFITGTCADTARLFGLGTRLSELQQNALWDASYEGRWVRWRVRVKEVSSTFGQLQLQFKCPRSRALSYDGFAHFDREHRNALTQLETGSTVTLVGRLADHGQLLGLSLDDGALE